MASSSAGGTPFRLRKVTHLPPEFPCWLTAPLGDIPNGAAQRRKGCGIRPGPGLGAERLTIEASAAMTKAKAGADGQALDACDKIRHTLYYLTDLVRSELTSNKEANADAISGPTAGKYRARRRLAGPGPAGCRTCLGTRGRQRSASASSATRGSPGHRAAIVACRSVSNV
jgi:hypothetical protein